MVRPRRFELHRIPKGHATSTTRSRSRIRTPSSWFRARCAAGYTNRDRGAGSGVGIRQNHTRSGRLVSAHPCSWDHKESNPVLRGKSPLHRRQCFDPGRHRERGFEESGVEQGLMIALPAELPDLGRGGTRTRVLSLREVSLLCASMSVPSHRIELRSPV